MESVLSDEDVDLQKESKFRSFTSNVEKVLRNFEGSSEWADLISAIGKLNKILTNPTYSKYHVIPKRIVVAKRLAQCMHPALPGGVHLKALECYSTIFQMIQSDRLRKDLLLWSSGLFPLLHHAAISVKPMLLIIYEEYYLPLGKNLQPALEGFLNGLLPGLEEGSEYYDRVNALLENICQCVTPEVFYSSLWECVLTFPEVRFAALSFFLFHCRRDICMDDQLFLLGNNLENMVSAICCGLEDSNILVQRSSLDILIACFSFEKCVLTFSDMSRICAKAVLVLLRREMSLNRRLYSWLLGSDTSATIGPSVAEVDINNPHVKYLEKHSKYVLISALQQLMDNSVAFSATAPATEGLLKSTILKPYRIMITLLDKPEIGSRIIDDILMKVICCLYKQCHSIVDSNVNESDKTKELNIMKRIKYSKVASDCVKQANLLFSSFEASYLWDYLCGVFRGSCSREIDAESCVEVCKHIDFLLDVISVEIYKQTQTEYLPNLLQSINQTLAANIQTIPLKDLAESLKICGKILSRIEPATGELKESCPDINRAGGVTVVESCVQTFHVFLGKFLTLRVLPSPNVIGPFFKKLILPCNKIQRNAIFSKQRLNISERLVSYYYHASELASISIEQTERHELSECFKLSTSLLLELSCFPTFVSSPPPEFYAGEDSEISYDIDLPEWLESLLVCSCFVSDFFIQTLAISTLLDLIALTRQIISDGANSACHASKMGSVSVVIAPSLLPKHLFFLTGHTTLYQDIASILWNYLSANTPSFHQKTVELFHQLQQESPRTCDDVIGIALVHSDTRIAIEAQRKFSLIWHISRNYSTTYSLLDRPLFIMIDCLSCSNCQKSNIAMQWLIHAIKRGDLSRILEPILLTLLHPSTARLSYNHWNSATIRDTDNATISVYSKTDKVVANSGSSSASQSNALSLKELHFREVDGGSDTEVSLSGSSDADDTPAQPPVGDSRLLSDTEMQMTMDSDYYEKAKQEIGLTIFSQQHLDILKKVYNEESLQAALSVLEGVFLHVVDDVSNEVSNENVLNDDDDSAFEKSITTSFSPIPEPMKFRETLRQLSIDNTDPHCLYYVDTYDTERILHAFSLIENILNAAPVPFINSTSSTNILSTNQLQELLSRHKSSIMFNRFYGAVTQEVLSEFRNVMYLEVLISICLYFIQSTYQNPEDVNNVMVQVAAARLLEKTTRSIIDLIVDGGFSLFIYDILQRCRVSNVILLCLASSVKKPLQSDLLQVQLLNLTFTLVKLEDRLYLQHESKFSDSDWEKLKLSGMSSSLKHNTEDRLSNQSLFLATILAALRTDSISYLHNQWINSVLSSLPYLDYALKDITVALSNQLCRNIEIFSGYYDKATLGVDDVSLAPPDSVLILLEALMSLCQYCLVECARLNPVATQNAPISKEGGGFSVLRLFGGDSQKAIPDPGGMIISQHPLLDARKGLLNILPRIVSALLVLWISVHSACVGVSINPMWILGSAKDIRQRILDIVSTVAIHHPTSLLAAVALVWGDRGQYKSAWALSPPNEEQRHLVDVMESVKALPPDTLLQTVRQVIKQPPVSRRKSNMIPIEVNMLQFTLSYLELMTPNQLKSSWDNISALLRDGHLTQGPVGHFILFGILNDYVQRTITDKRDRKEEDSKDKKDSKDVQDVATKLVEALTNAASMGLEQPTWMSKQMVVKRGYQTPLSSRMTSRDVDKYRRGFEVTRAVEALVTMAESVASLFDVVWGGDEKDKFVLPMITNILYIAQPYLRTHTLENVPSLQASSALVSSLSGYQYTRKAWRKDIFDIFMDRGFFQVDYTTLVNWHYVIDHLFTHDKTSLKELTRQVAAAQSGVSIFTNKDQEMDQRGQLMKRFAFTVFSSEPDQYIRSLPEILERITECLKTSNSPVVHREVFLFFRVLLLRITSNQLDSLWPVMTTELLQVFLRMERDLSNPSSVSKWPISAIDEQQMSLYLSACKLLDLLVCLNSVPQFHLYKWAFIGEDIKLKSLRNQFVPFVVRVGKLLISRGVKVSRLGRRPGYPLLLNYSVSSAAQLLPLFVTLCPSLVDSPTQVCPTLCPLEVRRSLCPNLDVSFDNLEASAYIERSVYCDFLEPISH